MFSYKYYRLVKALHESETGYRPEPMSSSYDNNIGECPERFYVAGCLYDNHEIEIPCFGCSVHYSQSIRGDLNHVLCEIKSMDNYFDMLPLDVQAQEIKENTYYQKLLREKKFLSSIL